MVTITRELIQAVRDRTGLGLMDCRKALEEAGGDIEQAVDSLRKKGAAVAIKRAGKETSEGVVQAYIHPGNKLGVLVEINCETDFVANTSEVQQFANDLCMHIAALKPLYLSPAEVDPTFLEHEKDILRAQLADSGKPANVIEKILEGKLVKLYSDICLLNQSFVKNDQLTVEQKVQELIGKTGEKIQIRRFSRFEIGA
jgi:elongation factor Ts